MKVNNFNKTVFFIIAPFLSLPSILYGIYKKSTFSLGLFVVLLGLLSFLYVPNASDDKAFYYSQYELFKSLDFKSFRMYILSGQPDFILHFLLYSFVKIGVGIQYFYLFITITTVSVWFYIWNKTSDKNHLSNKQYFLFFVLIIFSFSYPGLFSGTRFYFSNSLLLLGYYFGVIENKRIKGLLIIIFASLTHFSILLFLPIYIVLIIIPHKNIFYKGIFLLSFIFVVTPKGFIVEMLSSLSSSGSYSQKIESYTSVVDFIESGIEESENYMIAYVLNIAWSFFAYIYLIATIKRESLFRNLIYINFAIINVFYSITTVHDRYLLIAKALFVFLVIYEAQKNKNNKVVLLTLTFFALSIIGQLIISRNIIEASYFNYHTLSLVFVFLREITPLDFIQ